MSETLTVDSLLATIRERKKPMVKRVPIVLDPDAAEALEDAQSAYELAKLRLEAAPKDGARLDDLDHAANAVEEAKERAAAETVVFVFQAIGRIAWDELVTAHRPTDKQRTDHRRTGGQGELEWNPETFPPALVAASLVEPALSSDDVRALWDDSRWNLAELMALFTAAVAVNQQRRLVDL
jgi:hypothetical protein